MSASPRQPVVRIAFDAMGGYHAAEAPVQAAAAASLSRNFSSVLVGDLHRIDDLLGGMEHNPERLTVVHAARGHGPEYRPSRDEEIAADASLTRAAELL